MLIQNQFEEILTVGGAAPKPGADSTVNPQNKGPLLTGSWGAQGGSEVHYDPKNDTLTITSEKMLRTTSGGNTVETDSNGKIAKHFSDIPEPTVQDVETLAVDALTGDYEHLLDIVMGTAGAISNNITNPDTASGNGGQYAPPDKNQMTWDQIKENDPERIYDHVANPLKVKKNLLQILFNTASNAVAVREVLKKLGAPESEVEKTGGGYGQVYSQTEYTGNEIPENLRGIINKKME